MVLGGLAHESHGLAAGIASRYSTTARSPAAVIALNLRSGEDPRLPALADSLPCEVP
jgi:hypothetical protein